MPRPSGEIAAAGGRIRNIVIAARGSSDHAGTYGKYMLEILTGVPVSLAACSVVTAYKTEMDYSGCLVVGLSQSGAAEDVAQVLARARLRRAHCGGDKISRSRGWPARRRTICACTPARRRASRPPKR